MVLNVQGREPYVLENKSIFALLSVTVNRN